MTTFTVTAKCEAGHENVIHLKDVGNRQYAEMYAAILDGSFSPDGNAKLRKMNDPTLRVGRCNLPLDVQGHVHFHIDAPGLCNAWINCTVEDGEVGVAQTVSTPTPGGGINVSFDPTKLNGS